jgi:hypothetical protein
LVSNYPYISTPGYLTHNSPTPTSSVIFCQPNQSPYPLKSIVVANAGSISGITLSAQDATNSVLTVGKARGSVLAFDNPPISRCYTLNFPSAISPVMNNLQVQFVYDSTSNVATGATRNVGSGYGYGNLISPSVSNQNAGKDFQIMLTSNFIG